MTDMLYISDSLNVSVFIYLFKKKVIALNIDFSINNDLGTIQKTLLEVEVFEGAPRFRHLSEGGGVHLDFTNLPRGRVPRLCQILLSKKLK